MIPHGPLWEVLKAASDVLLVVAVAIPCALIVFGMRGLYLEARRALLERDK